MDTVRNKTHLLAFQLFADARLKETDYVDLSADAAIILDKLPGLKALGWKGDEKSIKFSVWFLRHAEYIEKKDRHIENYRLTPKGKELRYMLTTSPERGKRIFFETMTKITRDSTNRSKAKAKQFQQAQLISANLESQTLPQPSSLTPRFFPNPVSENANSDVINVSVEGNMHRIARTPEKMDLLRKLIVGV